MAMLKLYKCSILSCKMHTQSGKEISFIKGRYATGDKKEIEFLDAEVEAGHPHVYVDSKETEVDSVQVDPVTAIKAKAIAEYIAEQAAKVGVDTGNTEQVNKVVTSSDALASVKSNLAK